MKNLKITKVLLSLMLMFGLTTVSFAVGQGPKGNHDGKAKIEHKVNKKDAKDMHFIKGENRHHNDRNFVKNSHNRHDAKAKMEHKIAKKNINKHHDDRNFARNHNNKHNVKFVNVYNDGYHRHHHHKHHYGKNIYYSYNCANDIAAKCLGTGICLAMIAAMNS